MYQQPEMQQQLEMQHPTPDWYAMQRVISDTVERSVDKAMRDVRDEIKELRAELKATSASTYSREQVDDKVEGLRKDMNDTKNYLGERITSYGASMRNVLLYGGAALTALVMLYQHISLH